MITNNGTPSFYKEKKQKALRYFVLIFVGIAVLGYFFLPDKSIEETNENATEKEKLAYEEIKKTITTGKSNVLNKDELKEFNTIRLEVRYIILKYLNEKEQARFRELSDLNTQRLFTNDETIEFFKYFGKVSRIANQEDQEKIRRFFELARKFSNVK